MKVLKSVDKCICYLVAVTARKRANQFIKRYHAFQIHRYVPSPPHWLVFYGKKCWLASASASASAILFSNGLPGQFLVALVNMQCSAVWKVWLSTENETYYSVSQLRRSNLPLKSAGNQDLLWNYPAWLYLFDMVHMECMSIHPMWRFSDK